MSGNTFGEIFKVTTFGESHGFGLGCIIDGCPSGVDINIDLIQRDLDRRKPGSKKGASSTGRNENDRAEILSGIFNGKSTGSPIAILIRNSDQHSGDYNNIKDKFRPGHADYTFTEKYGLRDYRGGGRASGRETCARVSAGSIARMILQTQGISITAYTKKAATIECTSINLLEIENNNMRAPDSEAAILMENKIKELREQGDSAGGIVECIIQGVPSGLGEPVFDKLDALLAQAMLSIGAVKGIEFGSGFKSSDMTGSCCNDEMRMLNNHVTFCSNNAGGILGGISRGDDIIFRVAVKPVPSIYQKQQTVDTSLSNCDIEIEGRHDICLCPRIVPVVEAMTCIVLADLLLRNRASRI